MTRFSFSISLSTSSATNLATAANSAGAVPNGWTSTFGSYLPAVRVELYMQAAATGHGYIGAASVSSSSYSYDLAPGTSSNPGPIEKIELPGRTVDLSAYYALGSNSGDKLQIVYFMD